MGDKNQTGNLFRGLLFLYSLLMLWLLFGRVRYDLSVPYWQLLRNNTNLTPFVTINRYIRLLTHNSSDYMVRHAVINLVGNVVMFIPFGFLFPGAFPKFRRFFFFFLGCLGLILLVETAQLFMLVGSMDIDDVMLNMLGFTLGFFLYKLLPLQGR